MRPHVLMLIATVVLFCGRAAAATPEEGAKSPIWRTPAKAIATAYGIDGWRKIQRLDFTFNVDLPNRDEPMSRQWSWWPHKGEVMLAKGDGQVTVPLVSGTTNVESGVQLTSEQRNAHKQFINDSYWLLFPFQIVWSNPTITNAGAAPLPIGEGEAVKVTAQYPDEGGYTPGDAYDLFVDPSTHRIEQWVFRRGGKENGSAMTWEKHRQLGPIVVSLDHWGADEKFHLWFTDVRAEVEGEDEPVTPEPIEP